MTHKEFTIWLSGLLDGKNYLTTEGIEFMKSKIKDIKDYPITPNELYPVSPYIIDYNQVCPMGGSHEYPDVWHGIISPPCKKCGFSLPNYAITYCNTDTGQPICNMDKLGVGTTEYSVPIKPIPDEIKERFKPKGTYMFDINNHQDYLKYMELRAKAKMTPVGEAIDTPQEEFEKGTSYVEFEFPVKTMREYSDIADENGKSNFRFKVPISETCERGDNCCHSVKDIDSWTSKKYQDKMVEDVRKQNDINPNINKLTDKEIIGETETFSIPKLTQDIMRESTLNNRNLIG